MAWNNHSSLCLCVHRVSFLKRQLTDSGRNAKRLSRILMVMFGVSEDLNTALGWYGCIYFWVAILAYSYAIYLGISSIAKEKRKEQQNTYSQNL